ncbi:NAD(P)/FAD-dependent oxidoreductase [Falsiroseomonas oryziterrae]|uniref:NAD(P)/FAD-dependent oxidoreductase n=1 Tax=Falsiroseomonas oryziterrae TaxID=2911368 RepID=UPI001F3959F3|nr:FAD-binding oxidoreductase [Roseomonas sp. NPKOSM-4]
MTVREVEVAVVGGGIVGLCAALELAREGVDVLVLDDAARLAGTTANAGSLHVQMQSRFIRMYPDQVPGLERSLPLYVAAARRWAELERELGTSFELKASGGLMVAENAESYEFLARKCEREKRLGLTVHMLDRAELMRVAPYLGEAVVGAEFCAEEGKLNPLLANQAVRRALLAAGGALLPEARVERIERDGTAWRLEGPFGTLRAGRVLLAAGAGTGALLAPLGIQVPTVAEPLHMNVTEAAAPLIGHLVQHAERMITLKQLAAGQVVIGGGWPARLAGPRQHPTVEASSLIGNLRLASHIVPRLARLRLIRSWAGVNTTVDGQCVLGEVPGRPGLFTAVPGDAGYTLGPLVGRLAAGAVLGRRDLDFDIRPFSPGRFVGAAAPA